MRQILAYAVFYIDFLLYAVFLYYKSAFFYYWGVAEVFFCVGERMNFLCFIVTLLFLAFCFGEKFLFALGGNFFFAFLTITLIALFCSLVNELVLEWIRTRRRLCLFAVSGALCLGMVACSKPYQVYETELVRITPPLLLLEPLPVPPFTGSDNEDLLLYSLTLRQNLQLCNARLEAIKKSAE